MMTTTRLSLAAVAKKQGWYLFNLFLNLKKENKMTNTNQKMTVQEWADKADRFLDDDTPLCELQEHLWLASFDTRQTADYHFLEGYIAGIERCQRRAGRQIVFDKNFKDDGQLDLQKDEQWRKDYPFLL
jgi:hypothetical protein